MLYKSVCPTQSHRKMCKSVLHEIKRRKAALNVSHRSRCKSRTQEHCIPSCSLCSGCGVLGTRPKVMPAPDKHSKLSDTNSYRRDF